MWRHRGGVLLAAFVSAALVGYVTARVASVDKLARVSDYKTPSGGTMVYYALDGGGQSVGYIVYLGQNGKVLRIE